MAATLQQGVAGPHDRATAVAHPRKPDHTTLELVYLAFLAYAVPEFAVFVATCSMRCTTVLPNQEKCEACNMLYQGYHRWREEGKVMWGRRKTVQDGKWKCSRKTGVWEALTYRSLQAEVHCNFPGRLASGGYRNAFVMYRPQT